MSTNVDPLEIEKFEALADRWWDPDSEFKPLHQINPLRLNFINDIVPLKALDVIDVGCGGGILSESMAQLGANVTGIDMGGLPLEVANHHAQEQNIDVRYEKTTAEEIALKEPAGFDVVTCLEMLEHVPDPSSVIKACSDLVKPGGHVFFSTINRNAKAYVLAVIGAEYILNLLPKGTHEYDKFIRPSELEHWARNSDLILNKITGMHYNPLTKIYRLGDGVDVNYIMHFKRKD